MWKVKRQTGKTDERTCDEHTTDKKWSENLTQAFSSCELKKVMDGYKSAETDRQTDRQMNGQKDR